MASASCSAGATHTYHATARINRSTSSVRYRESSAVHPSAAHEVVTIHADHSHICCSQETRQRRRRRDGAQRQHAGPAAEAGQQSRAGYGRGPGHRARIRACPGRGRRGSGGGGRQRRQGGGDGGGAARQGRPQHRRPGRRHQSGRLPKVRRKPRPGRTQAKRLGRLQCWPHHIPDNTMLPLRAASLHLHSKPLPCSPD